MLILGCWDSNLFDIPIIKWDHIFIKNLHNKTINYSTSKYRRVSSYFNIHITRSDIPDIAI